MFLRNVSGKYSPSFFIIQIDTDEPVDSLIENNLSTFIHEYIHFLQDLTLPYCIRENLVQLREFFLRIDQANGKKQIHLPTQVTDDDQALTDRQTVITWGGYDFRADSGAIQGIDSTHETMEGLSGQFNVYKYMITTTNGGEYHFGARDLLEYLAYKIESRHFPSEIQLPDLPYRTVDLLFEYYGLSEINDQKRVAIAEHCLLNDNPARRLMVLIEEIKGGVFDADELADDGKFIERLQKHNWHARGVPPETIAQKVHRRLSQLKTELLAKFPERTFPAIHSWLDRVMEYASRALAGRHMFAWLYGLDTPTFHHEMSEILREIGIPLLINKNQEVGTSLGDETTKDEFIQLLLAYEFSSYVRRKDPICPMYDLCERDNSELINDDCMDAPFRRAHEDELCPFGAFTKTHGLANISWYVNDQVLPGQRSTPPGW